MEEEGDGPDLAGPRDREPRARFRRRALRQHRVGPGEPTVERRHRDVQEAEDEGLVITTLGLPGR